MKYAIRRGDRQINRDEALAILDHAEYGVLSMVGEDGLPYGIPINFARDGDLLVFHCAPEGRKLDCLRFRGRASFCAVGRTQVLPGKFTTEYESVLVEGPVVIVEDDRRKTEDLMILCRKFAPEHLAAAVKAIEKSLHRTGIFEMKIERISGKAKRP